MKSAPDHVHERTARALAASLAAASAALLSLAFPVERALAEPPHCGALRVLFLSDSHALGPFGERLEAWFLKLPGAAVSTYAIGGSSPAFWFKGNRSNHAFVFHGCGGAPVPRKNLKHLEMWTPLLADILKPPAAPPEREMIVIGQGSNVPGTPSVYVEQAERLARAAHDGRPRTCVWIGPPRMRRWGPRYLDEVYGAIEAGLQAAAAGGAPCTLIDSRKHSAYPDGEGDGIHYPFSPAGLAAAVRWADGVIAELGPLVPAPPRPPRKTGCRGRPAEPDD
ncbi:MAG: hypothetical protein U0359_14205 [Byssovorax sp.]